MKVLPRDVRECLSQFAKEDLTKFSDRDLGIWKAAWDASRNYYDSLDKKREPRDNKNNP